MNLCDISATKEKKKQTKNNCQLSPPCWHTGYEQHRMSLNEPWRSVRAHQHRTMRARGREGRKWGYGGGLASNLQGLASNTIWRETIQFAGIREGEGGADEEQEQKD